MFYYMIKCVETVSTDRTIVSLTDILTNDDAILTPISASSENGVNNVSKLFDNSTSTQWISVEGDKPGYIKFKSDKKLNSLRIFTGSDVDATTKIILYTSGETELSSYLDEGWEEIITMSLTINEWTDISLAPILIYQNSKYYSFKPSLYNSSTGFAEVAIEDIDFDTYGMPASTFLNSLTTSSGPIVPYTYFKTIGNYKIITQNNNNVKIGVPPSAAMFVIKKPIYTNSINRLNSLILNGTLSGTNALAKAILSFDGGTTWKTYGTSDWVSLSITLPLKEYSSLTAGEKNVWNSAKDSIQNSGIDLSKLPTLNIESLITNNNFMCAIVVYKAKTSEVATISNLQWNADIPNKSNLINPEKYKTGLNGIDIKIIPKSDYNTVHANIIFRTNEEE